MIACGVLGYKTIIIVLSSHTRILTKLSLSQSYPGGENLLKLNKSITCLFKTLIINLWHRNHQNICGLRIVFFLNFVLIFFNDSVKHNLWYVQDLERIRKGCVISI